MSRRSAAHPEALDALLGLFCRGAHRQADEVPVRYFTGDDPALDLAADILVKAKMLVPARHGYLLPPERPAP